MRQPGDPGSARHDIAGSGLPDDGCADGTGLLALALCALSGGLLAAIVSLVTAWLR